MGIEYLLTAYLDDDGTYSRVPTKLALHDVVRVVSGRLEDNLGLLAYRPAEMMMLLDGERVLHNTPAVLARCARHTKMANASVLVIYQQKLYAVVVEHGQPARVVGMIEQIITTHNREPIANSVLLLGADLAAGQQESSGLVVSSVDVDCHPRRHIVLAVPLGGHCFVQTKPSPADGDCTQVGLKLLVGVAFIFLEDSRLVWYKCGGGGGKDNTDKTLTPGQALFVYNGGLVLGQDGGGGGGDYCFHGLGPRMSHLSEAYIYSKMHCAKPFQLKHKDTDETQQTEAISPLRPMIVHHLN